MRAVAAGLVLALAASPAAGQSADEMSGPSGEHEALQNLAGRWQVEVVLHGAGGDRVAATGRAEASAILGGRFLVVDASLDEGAPAEQVVYIVGFDRRNERYQVVNLDDSATYLVMAQGARREVGGWVATEGADDDPVMAAMGLAKEFVFALDLDPDGGWGVQTRFVDTRVPERPEQDFMTVRFLR